MSNATDGRVYRIHVTGGQNNLALLIGVFSDKPLATLNCYMKHAAVESPSDPVEVPTMDPRSAAVDLLIGGKEDAPGYRILNRLKLHPIDLTIVGSD